MKRHLLKLMIVLLVVGAIVFPSWKWYEINISQEKALKQQELQAIETSFFATYGQDAIVGQFVIPDDIRIYGISWSDGEYVYTSLNINGLWVEIARQEIQDLDDGKED